MPRYIQRETPVVTAIMDVTPHEGLSLEVNQAFDALLNAVDQASASEGRLTKSVCSAFGSILVACARIVAPKPELPNTDLRDSLRILYFSWKCCALSNIDRSFWEARCNIDEEADEFDSLLCGHETLVEAVAHTRNAICEARKALTIQALKLNKQSDEDYHYIGTGRLVREERAWRYRYLPGCECPLRVFEDQGEIICVVTSTLSSQLLVESAYAALQREHPGCVCIEHKSGWAKSYGVQGSFNVITLNEEGKARVARFADAEALFSVG